MGQSVPKHQNTVHAKVFSIQNKLNLLSFEITATCQTFSNKLRMEVSR